MPAKPRNAEDATRRNVRAANKKIAKHEQRLKAIEKTWVEVWQCGARVRNLERLLAEFTDRGRMDRR